MKYDYECSKCSHTLTDVEQSVKDKPLVRCPECGKHSLERVMISAPISFVQQEATTIGQQAERNTKKMGKLEAQERRLRDQDNKKVALDEAKLEMNRKINKMTDEQKKRYIENG